MGKRAALVRRQQTLRHYGPERHRHPPVQGATGVFDFAAEMHDMTLSDGSVHDQAVLQSLLSVISDGVLATDINGIRLYSNPALDHLVGRDACEPRRSSAPPGFLPTESYERYLGYIDLMRRGSMKGDCVVLEFAIIDAEGETVDLPMHLVPVINAGESIVGMLWVFLARESADLARAHRLEKAIKSIAGEIEALGYGSRGPIERDVPGLEDLSNREAEVLELLLDGHRVSTMAEDLCVSTHTVRNHLKSIFKKAGVHSQADLIRLAKGPTAHHTSGNGHRS